MIHKIASFTHITNPGWAEILLLGLQPDKHTPTAYGGTDGADCRCLQHGDYTDKWEDSGSQGKL